MSDPEVIHLHLRIAFTFPTAHSLVNRSAFLTQPNRAILTHKLISNLGTRKISQSLRTTGLKTAASSLAICYQMNVYQPFSTSVSKDSADAATHLPPDLVVVIVALSFFQFLEVIHRRKVGKFFPTYLNLPFRDRFDWDKRALNLFFQLLQFPFNVYLLLFDSSVTADYLYGYSSAAHVGFLIIIAFYVYDTTGMIMHPQPPSTTPQWILHHLVATGLLLFDVSYKRTSAFPAAAFLISAVGHVPNELRWLFTAMNLNNRHIVNTSNILGAIIVLLSSAMPPPFLLYRSAQQLDISVWQLITSKMRPYCLFFFSLIYVPHVGLTIYHFVRAYTEWNKLPGPFRPTKVD